jgi:hypothetical protein
MLALAVAGRWVTRERCGELIFALDLRPDFRFPWMINSAEKTK